MSQVLEVFKYVQRLEKRIERLEKLFKEKKEKKFEVKPPFWYFKRKKK